MTPLTIPVSFVTTTVVDWVDVFTRLQYKQIVVESLRYCQQNKGLTIYAWVLMTNHLHLVVGIKPELHKYDYNRYAHLLSGVMRDFKKFTSKQMVEAIKDNAHESRKEWMLDRFRYSGANDKKIKEYRFWQEGYHEEEVFSAEFMRQKIDYIHQNPVRQGSVACAEDYLFSSARNYAGLDYLLNVEVVDV